MSNNQLATSQVISQSTIHLLVVTGLTCNMTGITLPSPTHARSEPGALVTIAWGQTIIAPGSRAYLATGHLLR